MDRAIVLPEILLDESGNYHSVHRGDFACRDYNNYSSIEKAHPTHALFE
jgi:hypothetical protein